MTAKEQAERDERVRQMMGLQALTEEHPAWLAVRTAMAEVEQEILEDLDIPTLDPHTGHKFSGMVAGVRRVRHRLEEWRAADVTAQPEDAAG